MKFIIICLVKLSLVIHPVLNSSFFNSVYSTVASILQYEICQDPWILKNVTGLKYDLKKNLHGQHLVSKAVFSQIKGHVTSDSPEKALVLSFHGSHGTGKTFVSKMIASHLFKQGMKSKFVHRISATREFPREKYVTYYKDQLRSWIEGNASACPHSLFIFEEMNNMPEGLIDTIKPYLDHYHQIGGVDFRKAIFLFLGNSAGNDINEVALKNWNSGAEREDIKFKDLENVIIKSAFNTKRGLWHSDLIREHLVTAYIPFLPLTKKHVMECIRDELVRNKHFSAKNKIKDDTVNTILNEMTFYPEDESAFSSTGCKRVVEKMSLIMNDVE